MTNSGSVKVSVIIKALNEEQHIGAAIQSAINAVDEIGGEVILADSVSTDDTISIAKNYPVTVVQLRNAEERRCGIGPQLGYQVATGEFIYILDGDMELDSDFLQCGIEAMEKDPELGGVAGLVVEKSEASYQFRGRKRRQSGGEAGDVGWLDMGGLYRRSAIEQVDYFSNRNLHSFEEMELGFRLLNAGWKLRRLSNKSVVHHGYQVGNWKLLLGRWQSRYLDGGGEVIRASLGKPYLMAILLTQKHLVFGLAVWSAILISIIRIELAIWVLSLTAFVLALLVIVRSLRIGNLRDALFAQVVWQVTSIASIRGFFARNVDPLEPIDYLCIEVTPRNQ
ncbi:MAG: glycosyltransferase [candidate division Zixibacteria bacterium]